MAPYGVHSALQRCWDAYVAVFALDAGRQPAEHAQGALPRRAARRGSGRKQRAEGGAGCCQSLLGRWGWRPPGISAALPGYALFRKHVWSVCYVSWHTASDMAQLHPPRPLCTCAQVTLLPSHTASSCTAAQLARAAVLQNSPAHSRCCSLVRRAQMYACCCRNCCSLAAALHTPRTCVRRTPRRGPGAHRQGCLVAVYELRAEVWQHRRQRGGDACDATSAPLFCSFTGHLQMAGSMLIYETRKGAPSTVHKVGKQVEG